MLPFLKRRDEASASAPPDSIERKPDDPADAYDSMHAAAEDLIKAVESKSVSGVADALRAAFELMEMKEDEHV